jgi:8-oxo-dGTP pyrophosphatase MutT (NUDIX family)
MNRINNQNNQSYGMIVVDEAYNTVIVQQYGKSWSFPKGRIEPSDKNGKACASREFREETGYASPTNASKLQYVLDPVYQLSGVKDPLGVTLIRPSYTDDGWTGEDKQITYYLVRTKDLGALEFNQRDPAITDMKILDMAWMSDKVPVRKKGMDHYYVDESKDEFYVRSNNGQGTHNIPPVHYTMHHKDRQAVFYLMGLFSSRMEEANERQRNN